MQSVTEDSSKHVGDYTLMNLLGLGPMSRVYVAKQKERPQQPIVLKLIEAPSPFAAGDQERFLKEAGVFAQLKHEYILPLLQVGIHKDQPYLVSDYAGDGSLHHRFARAEQANLPLEDIFLILLQVGTALDFAHLHNILHANLKPENILFTTDGRALVADFRLASLGFPTHIARLQSVNTARYMAPEQFSDQPVKQSDQYALACLAYEMCTGHAPFVASSFKTMGQKHATEQPVAPTQVNPELPLHVESALLKALSKDPKDRYSDIPAFLTAFISAPRAHTMTTLTPLPEVLLSTLEQAAIQEMKREKQSKLAVSHGVDGFSDKKETLSPQNLATENGRDTVTWAEFAQEVTRRREMQSTTNTPSRMMWKNVQNGNINSFTLAPDISRREKGIFVLASVIICISLLGFSFWSIASWLTGHKAAAPPTALGTTTPIPQGTPTTQSVVGLSPMPTAILPPRAAAPLPTPTPLPTSLPTLTPTPTSVPGPTAPVYPFFDCIVHQMNGTNMAYFGYMNNNANTVSIPIGDNNQFFPGGPDLGQPVLFKSGRQFAVFGVNFGSRLLVWSLDHHNVTASFFGPPCP